LCTEGAYFYSGATKKVIKVKIGKLITCVDRPERTSMFQIGDHNGKYSTNFGYAAYVDGKCKVNNLPACDVCRRIRLKQLLELSVNNDEDVVHRSCGSNSCSNWNVVDNFFSFPAPLCYPTKYDKSEGAAVPPFGREVIGAERPNDNATTIPTSGTHSVPSDLFVPNDLLGSVAAATKKRSRTTVVRSQQRLPTVHLTLDWLKDIIKFAIHNITTHQPSKKEDELGPYYDYLATCGLNKKLIEKVYKYARENSMIDPIPYTWSDNNALQKCHYAAMHMLFLGHTKSNFEMTSTWLKNNGLQTSFGKQVNKYFEFIQQLRVPRYFNAHLLTPSSWGTGTWVSENYVFWARTQKFWFLLPSIQLSKQMQNPEKKMGYLRELHMILRFSAAAQASMSCIMSSQRYVPQMDLIVKTYMDAMVEVDRLIHKASDLKAKPNFVKSNSLGILSVSESHEYFGPAILHWEGGYSGERKIQEVKPLLSIKRSNANWQQITLRRLYQLDSLTKLLESIPIDDVGDDNEDNQAKSRETEGVLKVYSSYTSLHDAVSASHPLSAVLDRENKVWVACRPRGGASRSSVELHEITFDDHAGVNASNICWISPIHLCTTNHPIIFPNMQEVSLYSVDFLLLLPALSNNGNDYINIYYCVGSKWTERTSNGLFEKCTITEQLFVDWIAPATSIDDEVIMVTEVAEPATSIDDEVLMVTEVTDNPTTATLHPNHFVEE
jgi:hypothetical protein